MRESLKRGIRYRHTQVGWVLAGAMASAAVVGILIALRVPQAGPVVPIVGGALLLASVLFCSLTVQIRDCWLECWFGLGLIKRRIRLDEVQGVEPVRNRWWYGWGIRLTPHGWLWNVSGLDAVEVTFENGKRFRIGSDEPEKLAAALRDERG